MGASNALQDIMILGGMLSGPNYSRPDQLNPV